jgi:hypothetical protein
MEQQIPPVSLRSRVGMTTRGWLSEPRLFEQRAGVAFGRLLRLPLLRHRTGMSFLVVALAKYKAGPAPDAGSSHPSAKNALGWATRPWNSRFLLSRFARASE